MTTKENVFEAVERIEEYLEGQRESQPGEGGDQDIETLLADWKRLRAPERFVQLACALQEIVAGDACVLVQPCGRSAHLELGYAAGAGKLTLVLLRDGTEPELMYRMCSHLCLSVSEVVSRLEGATAVRHG